MDLKKYYDFFGKTSFGSNSKIFFMKDGGFAIFDKKEREVTCYDSDCQCFLRYKNLENVVVLCESSCIVVKDAKHGGFHIYKGGNEVCFLPFNSVSECYMNTEHKSSIVITTSNRDKSTILTTDYLNGFALNEVDYVNPHNFKEDGYGNVVVNSHSMQKEARQINREGVSRSVIGAHKVTFLSGKRAIVELCGGGSELVSYDENLNDRVCLLHSDKRNGIVKLGNYAVVFEQKLIALADNGTFICEVDDNDDEEMTTFSPDGLFIKPYVVESVFYKGFYPSSSYSVFNIADSYVMVFFYHGKFYPMFFEEDCVMIEQSLSSVNVPENYCKVIMDLL